MSGNTPNNRTTQEIDENLRRVFREMEGEGVPDRFTDLLNKLRQQDSGSDTETSK
ncbi:MAG: NepR family anti-sigma factor [Jannaschia sp.]